MYACRHYCVICIVLNGLFPSVECKGVNKLHPFLCLDLCYVSALLIDGFGFTKDTTIQVVHTHSSSLEDFRLIACVTCKIIVPWYASGRECAVDCWFHFAVFVVVEETDQRDRDQLGTRSDVQYAQHTTGQSPSRRRLTQLTRQEPSALWLYSGHHAVTQFSRQ